MTPNPIRQYGEAVYIRLSDDHEVVIDACDYAIVKQYHWLLYPGKNTVYASAWHRPDSGARVFLRMHRIITDAPHGFDVDHVDHNGLNNRRLNIRVATKVQNKANPRRYKNCKSGFKGVVKSTNSSKWKVHIRANGRQSWVGSFDDPIEAARAYDNAAISVYGEFACLNFPQEAER